MNFQIRGIILTIIAFLLILGISGCIDQSRKAEEFLKEAQKHYKKAVNLAQEWTTLVSEPQSSEEFREAVSKGKEKLEEASNEIELTKKSLKEVKKLNVPDWRKRHADLLLKVCEKEIEVLGVAKEASKELQKIMEYVDELEAFSDSFSKAASHFEVLSNYLNKEKWEEAKKEAQEAKKDLESAESSLNKLGNLNIPGVDECLKAIDFSKKLADASYRYADAARRKNYSQASKAAADIKKHSNDLGKVDLTKLDFNSFIDNSLKPYLDKMDILEKEAKQLASSADRLYNKNTK
jgi:chemotaxis regulatin CheY-phosphate phosphatase CheZ